MANRADPTTLALALEERLGVHPGEAFRGRLSLTFDNDQRVTALFGQDGRSVTIITPVEAAHDGLPASILRGLLMRNAPNGGLAGGTLRVRDNQDFLEIANVVPLDLGAVAIADLMLNQADAAVALARQIGDEVAASLS